MIRRLGRRLLLEIADFSVFHPRSVLLAALLVAGLASTTITDLHLKTDVEDLLPRDAEGIREYLDAMEAHGEADQLYLILRGEGEPDADLRTHLTEAIVRRLEGLDTVSSVFYRLGSEVLDHLSTELSGHALLFLRPEDLPLLEQRLTDEALRGRVSRLLREVMRPAPLGEEAKLRLLKDPVGVLELLGERSSKELRLPFRRHRGYFFTSDLRDEFVVIQPTRPARENAFARQLMQEVVGAVNEAREEIRELANEEERLALSRVTLVMEECGTPTALVAPGEPPSRIEVLFTGGYPITLDYQCILDHDLWFTGILSFLGVMALFLISFRRVGVLLYAGLPLVVGLTLTLAFAVLSVGSLNVFTAGCVAMVCGLGVDYGIHLYNRYLEEVHAGRDMATAFRRTLAETGAGIAAASITTAVAFFALMLARVRGMRELGLICGVGMILTLISTLVMLPALVALVARLRPTRERDRGMSGFGLEPLTRAVVRHYRAVAVGLSAITLVLLGVLALPALEGRPYLNDDFKQFRPDDSPAIRLDEELEERMGARLRSFKVVLRDVDSGRLLDRTARVTEALAGREDLALVQSVSGLVPAPAIQSAVLEGIRKIRERDPSALDPERVSASLVHALARASGRPPGPAYLQSVDRARNALAVKDHLTLETLLDSPLGPLLRRFVSRGLGKRPDEFSSVVYVNPSSEVMPEKALDRVVEVLEDVDPGARVVGMKALGRVIKGQVRRDLALTTGVAFIGVLVCLFVTFRRPVLVALTALPVISGLIWSLGLLLLLRGEPFSLIGVSVIPLILGIGIDDGIHIVHRYRLHRGEGLARVFHHTGRAIAITSLTTIAAFGSLTLADYGGLRASGQMACLGIAACLVSSVVFLPALLTAVSRRKGD